MRGYLIPKGVHRREETVRRSRFIATVGHADTAEAAQRLIAMVRAEFPDATHHCWAWQLGAPGDTAQVRASDDGEPAGTAGRPMLSVLVAAPVGEVVAVVTRYFGGVKLGTGGLVRAYSGVLAHALETLPTEEKIRWAYLRLTLEYPQLSALYRALPRWRGQVVDESMAERAALTVRVPHDAVDALAAWVQEASAGGGGVVVVHKEE